MNTAKRYVLERAIKCRVGLGRDIERTMETDNTQETYVQLQREVGNQSLLDQKGLLHLKGKTVVIQILIEVSLNKKPVYFSN